MKTMVLIAALIPFVPDLSFAQESATKAEVLELREKLERLEKKLEAEEAAREQKAAAERAAVKEEVKKEVAAEVATKGPGYFERLIQQTKVGAYGSTRYGTTNLDDLHNTFTYRRFVLTVDSPIAERLKLCLIQRPE